MTITCFIRYQIDPFQRDASQRYAEAWARIIPRCGGDLVGYFLPHEGSNGDLAAYERYRRGGARLWPRRTRRGAGRLARRARLNAVPVPHEPRLARAAALVADPARSRMLAYLLSGEFASASELARAATVTAATASGHLAKLLDARFVVCKPRGRHRYYRLADADIAHALEALALVAERDPHDRAWSAPERKRLRFARCCYGHLAGRLAVAVFDALQSDGRLVSTNAGLQLTDAGRQWLAGFGMSPAPPSGMRRFAYRCLDWSERRDHLAGQLADELYQHFTGAGWLCRGAGRVVELTRRGHQELLPRLVRTESAEVR